MNKLFVRNKRFYWLLISLALPVVFQNMITIGVNIVDTMMLGSYGEIQLPLLPWLTILSTCFNFCAWTWDLEPLSLPPNIMDGRIFPT